DIVLLRPVKLAMVAFWKPLRGTSFSWFKDPVIRRLRMPIEAVKATFENVLKKAVSLPAHDEIPLHRLEVAIRRVPCKHFGVSVWINLGREIVDSRPLALSIFCVLKQSNVGVAIVLDACDWILVIAAHSDRHTKPINEVQAD